MDKIQAILLITILYLASLLVGLQITGFLTETEFCQENGFEKYEWHDRQPACIKKVFEGKEMTLERKTIYCEYDYLNVIYYRPIANACYSLKEVN